MATVKKMSKGVFDTAVADAPQRIADTNGTSATYDTHGILDTQAAHDTSADSPTTETGVQEPTAISSVFSLERLRRDSVKLFGVSTSTFDGATHGRSGKYSLAAMKDIISEWLSRPVANCEKESDG